MKVGILGLGRMGSAMARTLLRAGHTVAVWNQSRAAAEKLAQAGARLADSPADVALAAEVVLSSLSDDQAVAAAVLGDRAADTEPLIVGLAPGAAHVSLSTISPALSRRLALEHSAAEQGYLAAPVIGRPEAAERGELVILAAGPDEVIDACKPVFDVIGRDTRRLGSHPERANVVKLAANLVMASMLEVFGEAFAFADSYGIDPLEILGILQGSMLHPEVLDAYGKRIASGEFKPAGFRLRLGLKDVKLALDSAEDAALSMPFASALRDRLLLAVATGLGEDDWSAVARTLPHKTAA